jgi:hypothetical protein
MKSLKAALVLGFTACALLIFAPVVPTRAQAPKPKHINRVIDLWQADQPAYYTGSHSGTAGTFEQGKADAQTYADYLSYDMEHAPFDVKGLSEYMKGLVAGGPTKSGHRTPAVIVNVPVNGIDAATVRANAWMFQQVLATGVHGILLCHADARFCGGGAAADSQAGPRRRAERRAPRRPWRSDRGGNLGHHRG